MKLQEVLAQPGIWRGRGRTGPTTSGGAALTTGCEALDRRLPSHGWPPGAVSEILYGREGAGELSLILPALRRLQGEGQPIVCIAAPHVLYPPALEQQGLPARALVVVDAPPGEVLWAAEQALRSGACGAVLCWPENASGHGPAAQSRSRLDDRALRRLQLAAERGRCRGFVFRPARAAARPSPAALRLRVRPWGQLELVKCRGTFPDTRIFSLPGAYDQAQVARPGSLQDRSGPPPRPAAAPVRGR